MTIKLYRTDDRDPYRIEQARGFNLKAGNSLNNIRKFVQELYRSGTITSRIKEQHFNGKNWAISTDMGTFMGGYSKKFYYVINIPALKMVEANSKSIGIDPGVIKESLKPTLYLDHALLSQAKLIAVHVGPEKEVTFFTPIPEIYITHYAQNRNGPWNRMKGRTEFLSLW